MHPIERPTLPPAAAHRAPPGGQWPPAWASAWGDDRYGLWAELEVEDSRLSGGMVLSDSSGKVVQRFRWIEPGSFLMGAPNSEPERGLYENKEPYPVTLTQGFWLADTVCTQALWLAVVGGRNPSSFTGDLQLPVEQVTWDDVTQQFLPKLQALLPADAEATLPTEAQWEYACRANTTTPFSWGDNIHPGLVNYDGSFPYNGGPKGKKRQRTVPVLALPANDWGLYQMHGNIWEWCWDEMLDYAMLNYSNKGAAVDPTGAVGDGRRVLRGGSWFISAKYARSADRYQAPRSLLSSDFGFRVALRFK